LAWLSGSIPLTLTLPNLRPEKRWFLDFGKARMRNGCSKEHETVAITSNG
jgi:hypothetical protein